MGTSQALGTWRTDRAANLDALREAHRKVGGANRGRRWSTDQLNYAMILTLSGEWQGYCRDLHDEGFQAILTQAQPAPQYIGLIVGAATAGRQLNVRNPDASALARDFALLNATGKFWDRARSYDASTATLLVLLRDLVDGRNGIAHRDQSKIDEVNRRGYKLHTLKTFVQFRQGIDQLAEIVDAVVGQQVTDTCGGVAPW